MKIALAMVFLLMFCGIGYASEITTVIEGSSGTLYYDKDGKEVKDQAVIDKYKEETAKQAPDTSEKVKETVINEGTNEQAAAQRKETESKARPNEQRPSGCKN